MVDLFKQGREMTMEEKKEHYCELESHLRIYKCEFCDETFVGEPERVKDNYECGICEEARTQENAFLD